MGGLFMLYMLLICYDPSAPRDLNEPNRQPEHAKLEQELRAAGSYVSGAALFPVEMSKNVRSDGNRPVTTDGPFAETKEAVGGYYIVDCEEAEAVTIAARIPVDSRAYVQVRRIALYHPNVDRIAQLA
jgi:hypothetical protein